MAKFKAETVEVLPDSGDLKPSVMYIVTVDDEADPPLFDLWYTDKEAVARRLSSQDVAAIQALVDANTAAIDAINTALALLSDELTAQGVKVTALEGLTVTHTSQIAATNSNVATNTTGISNLVTALAATDATAATLGTTVTGIQADLDAAEASLATAETEIDTAKTDIIALEGRATVLETDSAALISSNATITSSITTLDGEVIKQTGDFALSGDITFNGQLNSYAGSSIKSEVVTESDTVGAVSNVIYADTSAGSVALEFPETPVNGTELLIKKTTDDVNTVSISRAGVLFNGVSGGVITLTLEGDFTRVQYDATLGWQAIGGIVALT